MKVRFSHLAAAAAVLAAAALPCALTERSAARHIAIAHVHPALARPAQQLTPQLLRAVPEQNSTAGNSQLHTVPHPAATARPLRPIFPWWFHRRHVAASQTAIA